MIMGFRPSQPGDLAKIMMIIRQAQEYLRLAGIDQWQNGYPNKETIWRDIERGNSYVLTEDDQVVGTTVLEFDGDPNYDTIYEGAWITTGPYGAIHRIAVANQFKGGGLATKMIRAMAALCRQQGVLSLRVDTHKDNKSMQTMLQKNGFQYCGVIHLADGSPRVAFEKVLHPESALFFPETENAKVLGVGNTATIYEWSDGKVLKLFHEDYPTKTVEKEFSNALAIKNLDFPKAKAYEIVTCGDRVGIVYDRVPGVSLLDLILQGGDVENCAKVMADLHKKILQYEISAGVPDYKEFLRFHVNVSEISEGEKEWAIRLLEGLPEGDTLCHGDFHPGNILMNGEIPTVIDFMNVCRGDYLFDVARTVFLVKYTPVSEDAIDQGADLRLKKTLSKLYLGHMGVTMEMIQDYLEIISLARQGECPHEYK